MEKELYEYLQNFKESNIDTREIKKGILRIKRYVDDLFDCMKLDLEDGDITKKEVVLILEYFFFFHNTRDAKKS